MTKEDFVNWKNSPVTREIFAILQDRVDNLMDNLSTSAGINPLEDRHTAGAIAGYRDLLLIDEDYSK